MLYIFALNYCNCKQHRNINKNFFFKENTQNLGHQVNASLLHYRKICYLLFDDTLGLGGTLAYALSILKMEKQIKI